MAEDVFAPKGATKASKPDAGQANLRTVPVFAIVKDTVDPIRSGRIQVYIDDMGGSDPDDRDSWMTVNYMPPFYGLTDPRAGNTGYGDYKGNPSSYGMWYSPPDIGSTVICIFINGDPNYGFWIGCVPVPEALYMVPSLPAYDKVIVNPAEAEGYGGATRLPVVNINTNNEGINDSPNFLNEPRPVHSFQASIFNQQGIIRDPIRGPIGSSSQRESPSRVGWGISTPGRPIYEGGFTDETVADAANQGGQQSNLSVVSRRGGHTIVMDDGDLIGQDQLIRIRTALGHQILMSDNGQTLMILHSNGQSYIELGKEGTIDLFSTNSVNIRTQGDLNLHADNDINIHAKKKLNVYAENINTEAEKNIQQKAGVDYKVYTKGKHTHKVEGPMSMQSDGEASYASKAVTYINGSKVNLNTGSTSTTPEAVPAIPQVAQTDTLYDPKKGWAGAPGKLKTIVSRAPAHCPWANAGQGVDVKTTGDASASLPSAPSGSAAAANAGAGSPPESQAVSVAGAATVPPINAASSALNQNATTAAVGAIAKTAATGPAAAALSKGADVVKDAAGQVTAAVGQLAQTPAQLASGNIIKPGSQVLVQGMVAQGANAASAMTSNLFKGTSGAQDLPSFANNIQAQVQVATNTLQQAQTALTQAGVMTGKEAPGVIAGLVTAGATAGVGATLDAVKNLAGSATSAVGAAAGALAGGLGGVKDAATSAIAAGNFAGNLSENVTGGMGGIANALGALGKASGLGGLLDSAKGVAGSAFDAIKNSFPSLEAGVPQDLKAITSGNALSQGLSNASDALGNIAKNSLGGVGDLVSSAGKALGTGASALAGAGSSAFGAGLASAAQSIGGVAGAVSGSLTGAVSGALSSVTSGASALASAGGLSSITQGLSGAGSAISGIASGTASALAGGLGSAVSGAVSGAAGAVAGLGSAAKTLAGGASSAVANGLKQIESGAASAASSFAAGIDALPAGPQAVSTILNNAAGGASPLSSLPGTQALGGLIDSAKSAATNGISLASAAGAAAGALTGAAGQAGAQASALLSQAQGAAGSLLSAGQSLASSVTSALPADASTALNSAISSLSAGGSNPIKLPTIGLNTNDRSSLEGQITGLLTDPKIPKPNFTGAVASAAKAASDLAEKTEALNVNLSKEFEAVVEKASNAVDAYRVAKDTLPAGSPEIQAAKEALDAVFKERDELKQKLQSAVA